MTTPLKIGALAAELNLNPKTIRYYEQIGLLPDPERTAAGYRLYGREDQERLEFILKAKCIGLTLGEIREVLSLRSEGQRPCQRVLSVVDEKVRAIDEQLRTLSDLRDELLTLRNKAAETMQHEGSVCSIIEEHETVYN
jgi:MerR family Zn(II)-responsive transcriptional regulator of zntA